MCNYGSSVGFPSKRLGLQFVSIYFVVLLRTSQALQFQTAFLLINSIAHAILDDIFSFLTDVITNTCGLGSLQNTENETNLLLPLGIQKLKDFQLQGALLPDSLTRGSAPEPCWGLRPRPLL